MLSSRFSALRTAVRSASSTILIVLLLLVVAAAAFAAGRPHGRMPGAAAMPDVMVALWAAVVMVGGGFLALPAADRWRRGRAVSTAAQCVSPIPDGSIATRPAGARQPGRMHADHVVTIHGYVAAFEATVAHTLSLLSSEVARAETAMSGSTETQHVRAATGPSVPVIPGANCQVLQPRRMVSTPPNDVDEFSARSRAA